MLTIDQRLRIAVQNCLFENNSCTIHDIRRACMELVAEARVEDINAAVVDMLSEGKICCQGSLFYNNGQVIPQ